MVKLYFSSIDGEVFINLPYSVRPSTILSIMKDCGFTKCYTKVHGCNVYKDF